VTNALPARRLMLVHAHPDDEVTGTGATMAHYAALGAHVTLVTCTLGEEGEIHVPELAQLEAKQADQLGGYRLTELDRACAALVRDVVQANLAHVVLAHLSENCNDHGIAHAATADALRRTRFRGRLSVAMQHGVVGPLTPRPSRAEAEAQYALAL